MNNIQFGLLMFAIYPIVKIMQFIDWIKKINKEKK